MGKNLVAIPAYNCEKQVPRVLERIQKHLLNRVDEVIVIENRSTRDNTLQAAIEFSKSEPSGKIKVIQNNENYGLGGSHKVAINYGLENNFDYICFIHGDDQTNPKEMNALLDCVERDPELSAALGARFMKGSTLHGYNFLRKVANFFLVLLYTIVTFKRTYELGAGLSVHRLSDFKDLRYQTFTFDFNYYIYMLLDYYSKRAKVKFVPISYYETDQISNVGNFHIGMLTLKCLFRWKFRGLKKYSYKDLKFSVMG
jgi:glycosyltransferase involved in cell wall biosynthesis